MMQLKSFTGKYFKHRDSLGIVAIHFVKIILDESLTVVAFFVINPVFYMYIYTGSSEKHDTLNIDDMGPFWL